MWGGGGWKRVANGSAVGKVGGGSGPVAKKIKNPTQKEADKRLRRAALAGSRLATFSIWREGSPETPPDKSLNAAAAACATHHASSSG